MKKLVMTILAGTPLLLGPLACENRGGEVGEEEMGAEEDVEVFDDGEQGELVEEQEMGIGEEQDEGVLEPEGGEY